MATSITPRSTPIIDITNPLYDPEVQAVHYVQRIEDEYDFDMDFDMDEADSVNYPHPDTFYRDICRAFREDFPKEQPDLSSGSEEEEDTSLEMDVGPHTPTETARTKFMLFDILDSPEEDYLTTRSRATPLYSPPLSLQMAFGHKIESSSQLPTQLLSPSSPRRSPPKRKFSHHIPPSITASSSASNVTDLRGRIKRMRSVLDHDSSSFVLTGKLDRVFFHTSSPDSRISPVRFERFGLPRSPTRSDVADDLDRDAVILKLQREIKNLKGIPLSLPIRVDDLSLPFEPILMMTFFDCALGHILPYIARIDFLCAFTSSFPRASRFKLSIPPISKYRRYHSKTRRPISWYSS